MKGKLPLFLRLTLVVILAVSFSLVPMVVHPKVAQAAAVTVANKDVLVEVGTSVNQPASALADVQRVIAGPNQTTTPTITVNVGDTVTFKPGRTAAVFAPALAVTTGVVTANSGMRLLAASNTYLGGGAVAQGDFNAGAAISVTLNASPVTTIPASPTVGTGATGDAGAGRFFPVSFKVPQISRKTGGSPAILKFSDGATDITVNMVVNQLLQFTPKKGAKGKSITVTGTGFRSSSSIDLEVRTGANIANGTGVGTGLPMVLTFPFDTDATVNHPVQVTTTGTFTATLGTATAGTATSGGAITVASGTATVTGSPVSLTSVTVTGSPQALVAGANVITATLQATANNVTTTTVGTITVTLPSGTVGTASSGGTGVVTGSPVALGPGANTVTLTTLGTITIAVTSGQFTVDLAPPAGAIIQPSLKVSVGTVATDGTGSFTTTFAAPELMGAGTPANTINARDGGNALASATELAEDLRTFLMDPSMTITPTSGAGGSTVTLSGSQFTPSVAVTSINFGGTAVAVPAGTTADANGDVAAFSVTVPLNLTSGKKSVTMAAGTTAAGSFTVSSTPLSLSPSTGAKGQEVVVGLKNMAASTAVLANAITIGGAASTHAAFTTDSNGNASVTVRVPTGITTTGAQDVIATVGATTATGTFNLTKPTITLTPAEQARTKTVTVTGKGWVPDKNVTINIGVPAVTTVNAVPDAAGNFTATFTVSTDLATGSTNNVIAMDTQLNTADTVTLKVPDASITVSPVQVGWGQTLTIKGTGFNGGAQVSYGFPWTGAAAVTGFSPAVYTDSAGDFTATLIVPTVTKGVRSIGANTGGAAGVSATTTVEVAESPPTIQSALSPIASQLVRVWAFDAASQTWKLYDPSAPAELSNLAALTKGAGYFINVKAATSITTGSGNTIALSPGWNLIGW